MNLRYILGAFVSIPLLPIMFFQAKKIKRTIPSLPEASGFEGLVEIGASQTKKLLLIGESTIAGVGVATHEEGFAGTLAKELAEQLKVNLKWKVYAKSGYTASRVHQKLLKHITETEADLIVIGLGGNDSFTLNTPAKWLKATDAILADLRLRYGSVPIFFTNIPPIKLFPAFTVAIRFVIGHLGEILGEELQKHIKDRPNVYFNDEVITLDTWIKKFKLENDPSEFFSDGVHPSKLTYQTWAIDMARFIKDKAS